MEYIGVELPTPDLEVIRRLAHDDDRSVGSQIRIAVATWISQDPKATLLKSALNAETVQKDGPDIEVNLTAESRSARRTKQ
jgi:hypothetical protein